MPMSLSIPHLTRRKSEGCLFQADPPVEETRKTGAHFVDQQLLEVLRRNYDFVSALADIDEPPDLPRPFSATPKIEISKSFDTDSTTSICSMPGLECSRATWIQTHATTFLKDLAEAFKTPREALPPQYTEQTKLSATALRRDLKRCFAAIHPLLEVGAALQDLVMWRNPVTTLLLVLVFFYSIIRGWTASLVLLLLLLQLSLNYLRTCRNIDVGLCFLPTRPVPAPQFDISGAQLIFDIAHVVQDLLNFGANVFEKAHNLMTWKEERVSFVFFCLVIYWLVLSMVFNTGTCLGMCAFTLGIRIFVTTYLFEKFPLLRLKLGTYEWFYRNLPVKGPNEFQQQHSEERKEGRSGSVSCFFKKNPTDSNLGTPTNSSHHLLDPDARSGSFSQLSGASDEDGAVDEPDPVLDGVVTWRHCVLHARSRPFPKSLISGVVYLTDVSLVFRAKSASAGNSLPPLTLFTDIISVKKMNTLRTVGLIAGSRKAVELTLANKRRPVQLLGVHDRDEFVEKMKEMCQRAEAATHFIIDEDE